MVPGQGKQSGSGDNDQGLPQSRSPGKSLVQGRPKVKSRSQGEEQGPESQPEICF